MTIHDEIAAHRADIRREQRERNDVRPLLTAKGYLEDVLGGHADWQWLGGGDPDAEDTLRRNGVTVAGWLPRDEVVRRLASAQVYVHTAAWEGAPISVLEASAAGLPIAARGIESLVSLGVPGTADNAAEVAGRIADLHAPAVWASEQRRSLLFSEAHTAELQREQLFAAYRHAPADLVRR